MFAPTAMPMGRQVSIARLTAKRTAALIFVAAMRFTRRCLVPLGVKPTEPSRNMRCGPGL